MIGVCASRTMPAICPYCGVLVGLPGTVLSRWHVADVRIARRSDAMALRVSGRTLSECGAVLGVTGARAGQLISQYLRMARSDHLSGKTDDGWRCRNLRDKSL